MPKQLFIATIVSVLSAVFWPWLIGLRYKQRKLEPSLLIQIIFGLVISELTYRIVAGGPPHGWALFFRRVNTPVWLLLLLGAVATLTAWFSKPKPANTVSKSQNEL
ncbi:MAG: hypothetical protein ABI383_16405 [Acidobacteriaceae bacterium]